MSKYTTEVRFICETESGLKESKGYNDLETIIEAARPKIFNFSYPIFDEEYKGVLETKILKHYYTREICEETVGLWKLRLNTKMNEIMPYYNKLYESEFIKFDPLATHDITREHEGTSDNTATNVGLINSTNNSSSTAEVENDLVVKDKYSDTPQGGLEGVEEGTYLTNAEITETKGETTTTTENTGTGKIDSSEDKTSNTVDHYLETVKGFEGINASKLLKEFRETLLNIDMMVIEDLEELFIQLW